jgi:hypothetical protein
MPSIKRRFEQLPRSLRESGYFRAIGKTGGASLPKDGCSDIDLFLFCDAIPPHAARESLLRPLKSLIEITSLGEHEHPHWGLVDSIPIGQQEVYLMYFTASSFQDSIDSILRGERTEREENYFYPTGRLASICGMHAFHDPAGYLAGLKARLSNYPDALQQAIFSRCLPKIDDQEDFMRAIRRGDVLFFHATLDLALDRFLQALFARNRVYFPSRKRSLEYIEGFAVKPQDCEEMIKRVLCTSIDEDTLIESYTVYAKFSFDLNNIMLNSKH